MSLQKSRGKHTPSKIDQSENDDGDDVTMCGLTVTQKQLEFDQILLSPKRDQERSEDNTPRFSEKT